MNRQQLIDMVDEVSQVANLIKSRFVGKDEMIDLLITCAVAQEHLLIVGPPGTAKSDLIKRFALLCSSPDAQSGVRHNYFEYLLTRFTEPNEIFGPINLAALRDGSGTQRNTTGMLPRAEIAFLDEVFKGNSAILNALLTILNERVFYNGIRVDEVPLLCVVGASNSVPDDADLGALYDRFLLRYWTDNVEETHFPELFQAGWKLERDRLTHGYATNLANVTTTETLRKLNKALADLDLSPIEKPYREVIRRLRADGIRISDRRVIKLLRLIAASALLQKREQANPGDFWVLRHIWNDAEQIPQLQNILTEYLEPYEGDRWSTERPLDEIDQDLDGLDQRTARLRSDTDVMDHLQQLESLRRELLRHSSGGDGVTEDERDKRDQLLTAVKEQLDGLMSVLEQSV